MRKIVVASHPPEFCQGGGFHIRPGDYIVAMPPTRDFREYDAYCFVCAERLGNKRLNRMMQDADSSKGNRAKRASELMEWAKFRRKGLGCVSYNWTAREVEEASDRIQYECTQESWPERLERLRHEVSSSFPSDRPRTRRRSRLHSS